MSNLSVKITPENVPLPQNEIIQIVHNSFERLRPGLTDKLEVEIMFVDNNEIKSLNVKHRDIDTPTDVLSFPQSQFKEAKENILGSIIICPEIVKEKNEDISDVIKHGLLHLLGYDHEENEAEWEKAAKLIECDL